MNEKKLFNNWIDREFYGLSAYTLFQVLSAIFHKCYADEIVYVTLYEYFTGFRDDDHTDTFIGVKNAVAEYLGEEVKAYA